MRFPRRLLAAHMWIGLLLWAGFVVVVTVITVGVATFGAVSQSAWETASQLPRWYALITAVSLVREYMPLYVAHGQTRRQFGAQAAVTVALFAPFLSALMVAGYLLETVLYGLMGWPQVLTDPHLFSEPTQVPLVFAEHVVEFLAWMVAGAFVGAGFYRWQVGGLFTIPFGGGLILLAEFSIRTRLPFISDHIGVPHSPIMTLGVGLGTFLLGLALTWFVVRDMPVRNKPA
jgi:flagellar biosynthesis protein FliQ